MPDQLRIFISYSSNDSAFVDRLEADLRARDFYVWVDRRKLEGGQDWMEQLQQAIDRAQVLLLVISQTAIDSKYVRMEYRHAIQTNKVVIPLNYRTVSRVPMELNGIQWINFQKDHETSLNDLLIALSAVLIPSSLPEIPIPAKKPLNLEINEPNLVVPRPAPAPPNRDLNELFAAGVSAKAEGNLERAVIFWQQVIERDPSFQYGYVAAQLVEAKKQLPIERMQRLEQQADKAHKDGAWGQEIGTWDSYLSLVSNDALANHARMRIRVAESNQKYQWLYENAQIFVNQNNLSAAKEQLTMLWKNAPFYGDPSSLGKIVNIKAPPSFEEFQLIDANEEIKARSEKERYTFIETLPLLNEIPIDIKYKSRGIWFMPIALIGGIGLLVGMLTQSWLFALICICIAVPIPLLTGFRRALSTNELTSSVVSGVLLGTIGSGYFSLINYYDHQPLTLPLLGEMQIFLGQKIFINFCSIIIFPVLIIIIVVLFQDSYRSDKNLWTFGCSLISVVVFLSVLGLPISFLGASLIMILAIVLSIVGIASSASLLYFLRKK